MFTDGERASSSSAVVFVCEHGAAKSLVATTYFNKIAAERGLQARAVYRGVSPQDDLSANALKGLREDGLTPPLEKPSSNHAGRRRRRERHLRDRLRASEERHSVRQGR